jgi:hypothetical protein
VTVIVKEIDVFCTPTTQAVGEVPEFGPEENTRTISRLERTQTL